MADEPERPEPKRRPAPERTRVTIDVPPEVKRRLEWVAERIGWSITRLLETSAENKSRIVLADLKPEHREAYLAGTLDLDTAFPGKRIRRRNVDVPDETVVVSALLTVEARRQLDLYSRLTREPLAVVIDKLSLSMERRLKRHPPPEPDPEPTLDPDFAQRMMPASESEDA